MLCLPSGPAQAQLKKDNKTSYSSRSGEKKKITALVHLVISLPPTRKTTRGQCHVFKAAVMDLDGPSRRLS